MSVHPGPVWVARTEPTGDVTVWCYRKPRRAERLARQAFPGRSIRFVRSFR